MKLFKIFLFASLVMFISPSCSDDDIDEAKSIIGTWEFKKATDFEFIIKSNSEKFDAVFKKYILEDRIFAEQTYTFNHDGSFSGIYKFSEYHEPEEEKGSYTYNDSKLTLSIDGEEDEDSAIASINNNLLILTIDMTDEISSENFLDDIYYDYPEELEEVDRSTLQIEKATYIFKFRKK